MIDDAMPRRELLRRAAAGLGLVAARSAFARSAGPYGPFTMGVQSYSLRAFPLEGMLKRVRELGLRDLEGWDGHMPVTDDPAKIAGYRKALKDAGVHIHTYGVVGVGADPVANRRIFTFARAMGITTLSIDPSPDSFDDLDSLVREFRIAAGIHNHGPGNRYAHPEVIADAIKGHDERIGFCVDTGHYLRSDVDPVEVVRKYGARVYGVHLKDVRTVNGQKEFTEIGKGELKTVALLEALRAARFSRLMSLEYEDHPDDPMPYMQECLAAVRDAVKQI